MAKSIKYSNLQTTNTLVAKVLC